MTLRRGLARLDGVADAKLIVRPPHMQVRMKPGRWPDLLRMQQVIRDAGYRPIPDGVVLRVSGAVARRDGRLLLELDRMKTPVSLVIMPDGEDRPAAHLGERHLGQVAEVEGRWQADGQSPGGLIVTAVHSVRQRRSGDRE